MCFYRFSESCKQCINFLCSTEYANLSVNDTRKLYPGGFTKYTYRQFQNTQEFALYGGVIFDILANSNESHADGVFISTF